MVPKNDAHYSTLKVVASAAKTDATKLGTVAGQSAVAVARGTKHKAQNSATTFADYVLNMSEPPSLALLGVLLLSIVAISRRLPTIMENREQSMTRLKNALQMMSGFLF